MTKEELQQIIDLKDDDKILAKFEELGYRDSIKDEEIGHANIMDIVKATVIADLKATGNKGNLFYAKLIHDVIFWYNYEFIWYERIKHGKFMKCRIFAKELKCV